MRLDWDRVKGVTTFTGVIVACGWGLGSIVSCGQNNYTASEISTDNIGDRSYEIKDGNTLDVKQGILTLTYDFKAEFIKIDPDNSYFGTTSMFGNFDKARLTRDLAAGCKAAATVEAKWKKLSSKRQEGTKGALQNSQYFLQHHCK